MCLVSTIIAIIYFCNYLHVLVSRLLWNKRNRLENVIYGSQLRYKQIALIPEK